MTSPNNRNRNYLNDLEFLKEVRTTITVEGLNTLLKNHSHKSAPAWKVIVIKRALQRLRGASECL
jgi:hypothetical protein